MTPAQALLEQRLNRLLAALTAQPRQGLRRAIQACGLHGTAAVVVLFESTFGIDMPLFWLTCRRAADDRLFRKEHPEPEALVLPTQASLWPLLCVDLTPLTTDRQHGGSWDPAVLVNPFLSLCASQVIALKATVLLLLTLLIKARVQILAGSALGIFLLLLQTLVCLAVSGGLVLAAGGAALYTARQRRSAAA